MSDNTVTISFTEELLELWTKEYFRKHSRSRKKPIKYASHPSINEWCILPRISMNSLKQNWKSFTEFVVDYYGYRDLGISKCKCKVIIYRPNSRSSDLDNSTPKFVWDGLTSLYSGVLVDDNCNFIEELIIVSEIRKDKHEMDIVLMNCLYDKELLYVTREKERKKKQLREETMEQKKKTKKRTSTKRTKTTNK